MQTYDEHLKADFKLWEESWDVAAKWWTEERIQRLKQENAVLQEQLKDQELDLTDMTIGHYKVSLRCGCFDDGMRA